jgi:hypothetical protein
MTVFIHDQHTWSDQAPNPDRNFDSADNGGPVVGIDMTANAKPGFHSSVDRDRVCPGRAEDARFASFELSDVLYFTREAQFTDARTQNTPTTRWFRKLSISAPQAIALPIRGVFDEPQATRSPSEREVH